MLHRCTITLPYRCIAAHICRIVVVGAAGNEVEGLPKSVGYPFRDKFGNCERSADNNMKMSGQPVQGHKLSFQCRGAGSNGLLLTWYSVRVFTGSRVDWQVSRSRDSRP